MQPNGDMLRLARQRKGFHQTDAALRLGITQSLLSRYENRLNDPRDDFLSLAARVYEVRQTFFYQSDPIYGPPVSIHAMWRRKSDVSIRELDTIIAELNIRVMHLRRFVEAADVSSSATLPRLDVDEYGDPEEIAGIVRAHWNVQRGPLGNLTILAEQAGIVVAHSDFGGASVSGATFAPPGVPPLVVLNNEQPADRLRFTLAHEIGHLVMHRFPTRDMEDEANRFAAALLMPAEDIKPYFIGRKVDLPLLASMKPEWRVAMQALLLRAKSLGYVDRNREEYLWKQIGVRRLRLREPSNLDFEAERPNVISDLYRVYRDCLSYTIAEISQLLHLHEPDITTLYGADEPPVRGKPRLTVVG